MPDVINQILVVFCGVFVVWVSQLFEDNLWLRIPCTLLGIGFAGLGLGGLFGIID